MTTAIQPVKQMDADDGLALSPVMDITVAKRRLAEFQEFVRDYLKEGEDFGVIPGTEKPTLYKAGADKLCELYGLSEEYEVVSQVEDWSKNPPLFDYTIRCVLSRGPIRREGMGSCNSYEGKYRWREKKLTCPECAKDAIIKGKAEFGGGWVCWKKQGGCGAKFPENAPGIVGQEAGKIENDDIATLKNTILKMSKKRAKVDATLAATRSSGVFTQDMEDIQTLSKPAPEIMEPRRASKKAAKDSPPEPPPAPKPPEAPPGVKEPIRGSPTPPKNGGDQRLISEAQGKRFWAIARSAGWTENEIREWLLKEYGVEHTNDIKRADYDAMVLAVEAGGSH